MLDQASIEKIEDSIAAAAEEKNTKKIKEAISSNPEILKCDIYCPPLRGEALSVLMHLAAHSNNTDLADFAFSHGVDIESFCSLPPGKNTPLETAASQGSIDVVRFLLQNGANVNGRQENVTSPLICALSMSRNSEESKTCDEIVRLLVEYGADVNRLHRNMNLTPLDICRMWGRKEIESFLIEHGAIGESRESIDWDSIPGSGILLHVETNAGHVLPVALHHPQVDRAICFRQAIVNKKFRLLFTHGLFQSTHPHIELYSLLPLKWPMNKYVMESNSGYAFPALAMVKLICTMRDQLVHGFFVERIADGWQSLSWPADVEGLALIDHKWPKTQAAIQQTSDDDEDSVSLLLVLPLSASAVKKVKSKKSIEFLEKSKNSNWHQVVYPEI